MHEIEDELHGLHGELKSFPPTAHWFCPKRTDDDDVDYDKPDESEEDISSETKRELIQDAKRRHDVAYQFTLIFGLDTEGSGPMLRTMLEEYTQRLKELLSCCDRCVRNYHRGRKLFLKALAENFDDQVVQSLADRINTSDFARIQEGLASGESILSKAEPHKRNQSLLINNDRAALLALYESLCCVDFHKEEKNLSGSFNYVFTEIQRKKPLKLGDMLPAMTQFLFDEDMVRVLFATKGWGRETKPITPEEFEWAVHDALSSAIVNVNKPSASYEEIERFWRGIPSILERLEENLIRHSLRAMEVQPNLYFLALQHLTCNSADILKLVVEALQMLITKSSKDFWAALGTISPATVSEQIFVSPAYEKFLTNSQASEQPNPRATALSWIPDFLASLPAVQQHDACRSLLHHLFVRLQDGRFPEQARMACCRSGLMALSSTLDTFVQNNYKINPSTSLVVINDILGLVERNIRTIVSCADLEAADEGHLELKRQGMVVIRDALALDSKALSAQYTALSQNTEIQRGVGAHSQSIWQAVLDVFRPGNLDLAKSILAATAPLTGVDELFPKNKKTPNMPKDHVQYNKDFKQLNENVSRVFERLSDFKPDHLREICRIPQTARPLFAALMSADQSVYEAAVEVIKTMTEQDSRSDAMSRLVEETFATTLTSLTYAVARITKLRTFTPIVYVIKTSKDVLEALCGSTGVLRTRSSLDTHDQNAILGWWTTQWRVLDMIFSQTENWVARVNKSTKFMEEFCRDDMEYAEKLFDAYSIIATATGESSVPEDPQLSVNPDAAKASRRRVLQVVCQNVNGLSMMLRLRDKYLVSVITSLLSKLLRNLGEYDIEIDEFALNYIKSACLRENERDFKRTNLTSQQKAELQRALSDHQGVEIVEIRSPVVVTAVKKQGTIDAWSKSAEGKVHEPKTSIPLRKDSEKNLASLQQMKARQQPKPTNDFLKNSRQKAAEEKKQRDAAAIARAKALRGPSSLVPGEGSGLSGLGVHGKDHAPIRSEIMVGSSDEDSSDDNEDEDETNALVTKRKETSKMVSEYEESRRRALKAQQQGPVRKTKIQRSAKDLRARVEPNMDKLYLEILNWDIFHEGDIPPSNSEYRKIDNKYLDLDLYKRTFGPLLTSEVWRSLVTAKDENNFKPVEITIMNRLSVDKFMEVSTKMPVAANKDLKLSERDIVLFSKSHDPMHEPQAPHCLARVDRRTMKKDVIEVTYRVSRDCDPRLHQCLVPNGKIHIVKIADMTTTQREFAALSSLEYYDLCNEVLEAKPSPIQKYGDEKIGLMSSKYKLNRGQAQAILSANDNDGFTLIQGPPGSGKTKTIVAMVGALLTQTLQSQGGEQFRAKSQGNAPAAPPNGPKKKLLICAPSNAAVDELVVRLKEGVQPIQGPFQKINVIRIGRSDAINTSVKDVMLDELVQAKLEGDRNDKKGMLTAKEKLHQEAGQIKQKLASLREQLDQARSQGDKNIESKLQRELDGLYRNRAHINAKIEEDKENGNTVSRDNEINRRRFQQEIIDGAHVLCATLSGSGHDMFRNLNVEFESVIIDEAAQCIELSALIPLKYGCSKCILVGDPEQLPPTVLSKSAKNFGYEQSLFVRMQRNHPKDIHLLDTQYRMHPEISQFPSQQFYNSRLLDGDGMAELRAQPYHASTILGPYRFFDVKGVQTKEARGHSFINVPELNAAMSLYDRLKADYRTYNFQGKIGIIATYKAQLNELRSRFVNRYGEDIFDEIEFNTTDAFQGREREIIIFSCVRATASGGIGFLSDIRRMNVGLTRAKSSLWVLGDSRSLQQGEFWNKLIEDSKARDRYTGGDVLALLSKPTSRDAPVRQRPPPAIIKSESNSPLPQPGSVTNSGQSPMPDVQYVASIKTEVKQEEKDIEMLDAASVIRSRQSSMGSTSAVSVDSKSGVKRPREPSISDETAKPVKKMPHLVDPSKDKLSKNQMPAVGSSAPSAPKPTPRPQGHPPGAAPRKKKAPPDPFIQRKPARR